jgi:hypothetical protein
MGVRTEVHIVVGTEVHLVVPTEVHLVVNLVVHSILVVDHNILILYWTSYGSNPPKVLLWLTKKPTRS